MHLEMTVDVRPNIEQEENVDEYDRYVEINQDYGLEIYLYDVQESKCGVCTYQQVH